MTMTEKTESPNLLAALRYESLGWSVIPIVKGGKRPLIPSWKEFQTRRATADEIRQWWTSWPDANVAVVTGAISGIVILDVDGTEGKESLKGRELPPTPSVKTGKGFHYYFLHPGGTIYNSIRILLGLDVKGDGGYVVAPPSVHENGNLYEWPFPLSPEETPLVEMPPWLKILLAPKDLVFAGGVENPASTNGNGRGSLADYTELLNGVGEGSRNATAARLTGRLLSKGLPKEEVLVLLTHWNERNTPPLHEDELKAVVESIYLRDTINHAKPSTPIPPFVFKTPKLFTKSIGEVLSGPEPEIDWLVDSLFEKGNIGFIAGEPKLTKSWIALDLMVALATQTPFMGYFNIPKKRRAVSRKVWKWCNVANG
jgi:hypothetical protein